MSYSYMRLVYGAKNLCGPSCRSILAVLAYHADENGRSWPGIKLLEAETELGKRTILRGLQQLEEAGLLAIQRKSVGALHRGNTYVLDRAKLHAAQRPTSATESPVNGPEGSTGATESPVQVPLATLVGATESLVLEQSRTTIKKTTNATSASRSSLAVEVERVWEAYPLKKGKGAAIKAIEKSLNQVRARDVQDPALFLVGRIQGWMVDRQRRTEAGEFVPNVPFPQKFFNRGDWDDPEYAPKPKATFVEVAPEQWWQGEWEILHV